MVSAWPEPPDAMSVAPSAGVRCGVQGTFAIVGFIETPDALSQGGKGRRSKQLLTSPQHGLTYGSSNLRPTCPLDGSDHSVSGDCDDSEQNEREACGDGKSLST
jgi:hypothetical protein